eukprot:2430005-Amphidinium_carterae.1
MTTKSFKSIGIHQNTGKSSKMVSTNGPERYWYAVFASLNVLLLRLVCPERWRHAWLSVKL